MCTVSHASFISHFRAVRKYLFWFFVGARCHTQSGRCPGVSHVLIARMSAVAAISARSHASTPITRETRARLRGVLPAPTRAPTMSHRRRYANENDTAIVLLPEAEEYFREVRDDDGFLEAAPCDFFELLGLDCDCGDKDVKAAFKRLVKTTHPDVLGAVAEPLAVLLNSAYATLSNDATRSSKKSHGAASRNPSSSRTSLKYSSASGRSTMAVLSFSLARSDHRAGALGAGSTPRSRARVSRMIGVDAWDIADIVATALILAIRTWETPGHRAPPTG